MLCSRVGNRRSGVAMVSRQFDSVVYPTTVSVTCERQMSKSWTLIGSIHGLDRVG